VRVPTAVASAWSAAKVEERERVVVGRRRAPYPNALESLLHSSLDRGRRARERKRPEKKGREWASLGDRGTEPLQEAPVGARHCRTAARPPLRSQLTSAAPPTLPHAGRAGTPAVRGLATGRSGALTVAPWRAQMRGDRTQGQREASWTRRRVVGTVAMQ
jgi:hypothetical protein